MALAFSIAAVDAETIDRINIYQASRLAMRLAVEQLTVLPDHLIIDALRIDYPCAQTKLFYGDALSLSIAAASVVAKVYRDAMLRDFDAQFPQYGLAQHKGYGTPEHRRALKEHGPCPLHRRSFAPVYAADPEAALDAQLDLDNMFDELSPEELAPDELALTEPAPTASSHAPSS
jgi:ribonuclease HII